MKAPNRIYIRGSTVYFVSNNMHVIEAVVASRFGDIYTLFYKGITNEKKAGIRLPGSRIFPSKEMAEDGLPEHVRIKMAEKEERKAERKGFRAPMLH